MSRALRFHGRLGVVLLEEIGMYIKGSSKNGRRSILISLSPSISWKVLRTPPAAEDVEGEAVEAEEREGEGEEGQTEAVGVVAEITL